jgi:hypothetical protein
VLNHDDLLEMNIHVDTNTGAIPGIADWADVKIAPFGMSFWGLETLLGVPTSDSWLFHPSHERFRLQFWAALYEAIGELSDEDQRAIEVAAIFGLFRVYGFDRRPEKDGAMSLREGDPGFVYLETLCLRESI